MHILGTHRFYIHLKSYNMSIGQYKCHVTVKTLTFSCLRAGYYKSQTCYRTRSPEQRSLLGAAFPCGGLTLNTVCTAVLTNYSAAGSISKTHDNPQHYCTYELSLITQGLF